MWVDDEDKISQIAIINYEPELGFDDELFSGHQTKLIEKNKINSQFSPGETAFCTFLNNYVTLDKPHASSRLWDCSYFAMDNSEKQKYEGIKQKEMQKYIKVRICLQIENQVLNSLVRLDVNLPLQKQLAAILSTLNYTDFILISDSKHLDSKMTLTQLNIKPLDLIYGFGIVKSHFEKTQQTLYKFWRRYQESRSDGWYIGRDRWDGIIFQTSRNIRIFGCGIYEGYPSAPRAFKFGYKYTIQTESATDGTFTDTFISEVFEEEVQHPSEQLEDHIIQYMFKSHPEGIIVNSG